jgi:hypothetical protein
VISGTRYRRGRTLFWSTIASAVLHVLILTVLLYAVARLFVPRGEREVVSQTTSVSIERLPPTPAPKRVVHHVRQRESAPATTPHQELAKVAVQATPQAPHVHRTVTSSIERDEAGFSKEVAQLNQQNGAHAIPTIDPASQGSTMKSYHFDVPSTSGGDEHGNGIITPTQSWHDAGQDCYYGRYEYTYPDGAMEDGAIPWPFCYNPATDPFKRPPHPMPFPLPLPGYRLPPETQLPPIEKAVYDDWAGDNGAGVHSSP